MSKKHFIAIAAKIKTQTEAIRAAEYPENDKQSSLNTLAATTYNLCDVFADANPNFDRARFLTACGM